MVHYGESSQGQRVHRGDKDKEYTGGTSQNDKGTPESPNMDEGYTAKTHHKDKGYNPRES